MRPFTQCESKLWKRYSTKVILTVQDLDRSIAFYEAALKPLGIIHAIDFAGNRARTGPLHYLL
ncbi:MAG TPA: hypothetical protein VFE51_15770 [Verrucomicrobiae bacterium]|nr:hypothetical protein [Verrucomicrobiae bacterium]